MVSSRAARVGARGYQRCRAEDASPLRGLLPDYEISAEVWERAIGLADRGRAAGVTVPLADLLIFACAKTHGLEIAHDDAHFDELTKLEA